jgi:hypothetical protein
MEDTYRLEFREEGQDFHLEHDHKKYMVEPNTHGWITVTEHCTDLEFEIFEAFVRRNPKKKLTNKYVLEALSELQGFIKNLMEYNINIKK